MEWLVAGLGSAALILWVIWLRCRVGNEKSSVTFGPPSTTSSPGSMMLLTGAQAIQPIAYVGGHCAISPL